SGFINTILMGWYNWAQANAYAIKLPFAMTMSLMGLFICFSIAYNLAKHYKIDPLSSSVTATVIFLLVSAPATEAIPTHLIENGMGTEEILDMGIQTLPATYLDASGIFTAIVVGIFVVEIINFLYKKDIRVKMPEGVPPAISASFDSIIPMVVSLAIFYPISLMVQNFSDGKLIPAAIMTLLAPAMSGLDSLLGIIFITGIAQVFWFFGLHGASINQFVRLPFMNRYIVSNALAYEARTAIVHYFTQPFWSYIIAIGGGGSKLALVILMVRSKSKQLNSLGKLAIVPAIFNINEPIIFGVPLVLNPTMMIPFIGVPLVNSTIAYALMSLDIVQKGFITTPWTTPAPLGAMIGHADIKAGIMVIGLILLDIALYYPFFKAMEREKIAEES